MSFTLPAAPAWVEDALCAQTDPELFFPTKGAGAATSNAARRICAKCPVQAECLGYAVADPSLDGIWGGTTYRQRVRIRDRTAPAAA